MRQQQVPLATKATVRHLAAGLQERVEDLALQGLTAAEIERKLLSEDRTLAELPSRRTLQRITKAALIRDRSGPWGLGDAQGDEASLVLPVLRAYLNLTSLRTVREKRDLFITKAEARWIVRIVRAGPDIHVFDVYRLARAYLARESRGLPTYDLDALLAFEPWDDAPRFGPLGIQYLIRDTYRKGVEEGWIPPAPPFLMKELAGMEWHPKTKQERDVWVRALYGHEPDAYEDAALSSESEADEVGEPASSVLDSLPEGGRRGKARKR